MILTIIKLFLLNWFITQFKPLHWALEAITSNLPFKWLKYILNELIQIIKCPKCNGLWMTLIITQNIWFALLMSFIGYTYDKYDTKNGIKL